MTKKRKRGRPVTRKMPEPIPDTPENIARAIMLGPPKDEWRYLKEYAGRNGKPERDCGEAVFRVQD